MKFDKTKAIYLSLGAAVTTIILKFTAYFLTGSVGLLSDALESIVNLVGAAAVLIALTIAGRPADRTHTYGHSKAEYFSSGLEGGLILIAALTIGWAAINRLLHPAPVEGLGLGIAVSLAATLVNFVVARILLRVSKKEDSIALEADGKHLMTDVVTSVGVVLGLILVLLTGWLWLDSVVALGVAANIIFEGTKLVQRSTEGLMDQALPPEEETLIRQTIEKAIAPYQTNQVTYHGLRSRKSGSTRFIDLHLLVPGQWTVDYAHELAEAVERDLCAQFKDVEALTHLEPIEDPRAFGDSWEDVKH